MFGFICPLGERGYDMYVKEISGDVYNTWGSDAAKIGINEISSHSLV